MHHEALLWKQGSAFVFGVDEAGRGCLAGPVCAAVSCWAPMVADGPLPLDVTDSKLMAESEREAAFQPVWERSLARGVGFASAAEIDRWNILRATYLAVARALESALEVLPPMPAADRSRISFLTDGGHAMVDRARMFAFSDEYGPAMPRLRELYQRDFQEIPVVKGDSKVFSIACASVLAKVSRDRHMLELCRQYPGYGFSVHKGYGTPKHLQSLRSIGPCSEHRRSFSPVSEASALFTGA